MSARLATALLLVASLVSAQSKVSAPSAGSAKDDRAARLVERAHQDREIVYFLKPPETHAFELYHDVTETAGADHYLNVVRAGSSVQDPKAVVLDTGEALPVETLKGEAIRKAAIDIGEPVRPESEVVVIRFPKVRAGETLRLRITRDLHRRGTLPAGRRRARLRPQLRTAAQRGGAARGLLAHELVDPGDRRRDRGRARPPGLREPASRRDRGADHGEEAGRALKGELEG